MSPAKKRGEKGKNNLPIALLVGIASLLSLAQALLIFAGILPVMSSYSSAGTIIFNLAKLAIAVYAGVIFSREGIKHSALSGALLGFFSAGVALLLSIIFKVCCNKAILGVQIDLDYYWLTLGAILLENVLLWAVVAAAAAVIANALKKKLLK